MYLPDHFRQDDTEAMRRLIEEQPLGTLITVRDGEPVANHIPFLLEPRAPGPDVLIAHVARSNDVWHEGDDPHHALVVFHGVDAYISPTWYPTKAETHRVVPTWNYAVVHVHGRLVIHDDAHWVRAAIGKLTRTMERDQDRPWNMGQAPRSFLAEQVSNIVGIEIRIDRMVGKWKMSQNRETGDQQGAIAGLQLSCDGQAKAVARHIQEANH